MTADRINYVLFLLNNKLFVLQMTFPPLYLHFSFRGFISAFKILCIKEFPLNSGFCSFASSSIV